MTAEPTLAQLWDYRRRVGAMYSDIRDTGTSQASWNQWRATRGELFRTHPQSPITADRRNQFHDLAFAEYDQAWNLTARIEDVEPIAVGSLHSGSGETPLLHFADAHIASPAGPLRLGLFWIDAYGGGVFVPFRDATNGQTTYEGGRYILDTAKSADLGQRDGDPVFDFNFAYHPSCVHNTRWSCPLAPASNHLRVEVPVGEQLA